MTRLLLLFDHIVDFLISVVFIVLFLIGAYRMYDSYLIIDKASNRQLLAIKPESEVYVPVEIAEDSIAWLTLFDTAIDYPVMQGKDNEEYLIKDPFGEYSLSGSIFLDSRNSSDFSSEYCLLYGHHMKQDLMFGGLDRFFEMSYFGSHRAGILKTSAGSYRLEIFSVISDDAGNHLLFNPENSSEVISYLRDNAEIFIEPFNNHILGMSTCGTGNTTTRTLVFACLIPLMPQP